MALSLSSLSPQDDFSCTYTYLQAKVETARLGSDSYSRRLDNLTEDKRSQDGTVTAKVQAALRIYDDAASLVESIIKKISPSLPR
jgi:hypothetical protein